MSERRRFALASGFGAALALLVVAWMIGGGHGELLRRAPLTDLYDAQAHALLDGRLHVDPAVPGIEGFLSGGRTYLYQGPVPALLRIPVVALAGDRFDGRLSGLSVLAAVAVLLATTARVHWRLRAPSHGDGPVGPWELAAAAGLPLLVGAGSVVLFLSSRTWVYHEAAAWGAAFGLAALDQLLAVLAPRHATGSSWPARHLWACSALTAAALLCRVSVGLGPLLGLALVALLGPALLRGRQHPGRVAATLATVLPLAGYMALNHAKFGRLLSVPFTRQQQALVDADRAAFLRESSGTFFGLDFVPTTVFHYLRPDGLRPSGRFPFVDFPAYPGRSLGAELDLVDRAASLPASMPLLVGLALAGVVVAWRRHRRTVGPVLLAGAAGAATILPFGYVAHRYLADAVPVLVVAAALGIQALRGSDRRRWALPVVVLAGVSVWINAGLALQYQRRWAPDVEPAVLAGFVGFQSDVAGALGSSPLVVERMEELPTGRQPEGALVVIGDCDGLYQSDGSDPGQIRRTSWQAVERTRATGAVVIDAVLPPPAPGEGVLLLSTADGGRITLHRRPGNGVFLRWTPAAGGVGAVGRTFTRPEERVRLDVSADWRTERLVVRLGDRVVLDGFYFDRSELAVGPQLREAPEPRTGAPLCRRLVREQERRAR